MAGFNGPYKDLLDTPLTDEMDAFSTELIRLETERQKRKVVLIASESICPQPVQDVVASPYTNLYAEGLPGSRMCRWDVEHLDDFAAMAGIEFLVVDKDTDLRQFRNELRWNEAAFH